LRGLTNAGAASACVRMSERVREQLCAWRSARLVWGPQWRRSRCLTESKGNEGEHMCPFKNRESCLASRRWGNNHSIRETRSTGRHHPRSPMRHNPASILLSLLFANTIVHELLKYIIYEQYKKLSLLYYKNIRFGNVFLQPLELFEQNYSAV